MRSIALVLLLVGCVPYVAPDTPGDAAAFNACDPGSGNPADPGCGGGGGTTSRCYRTCTSNFECGGPLQECRFCAFGECRERAAGTLVGVLCAAECQPDAADRPGWCVLCDEALRVGSGRSP